MISRLGKPFVIHNRHITRTDFVKGKTLRGEGRSDGGIDGVYNGDGDEMLSRC